MSDWYYADRNRQRQGPMQAGELAALFRSGQVAADTLVWRDGLPQWQALGDFAAELGLFGDAPAAAAVEPAPAFAADAGAPTDTAAGRAVFEASGPDYPPPAREYVPPDSPYAAPAANVAAHAAVVHGGEVVYAGLWKRVAASVIDGFVTAALSYIVLIPLMLLLGVGLAGLGAGAGRFGNGASALVSLLVYPVSIGLPAAYFGWMQSSSSQASLGKMAVGIKVVRTSGEPIAFWRGFLRYVAYALFAGVTCGLGVLASGLMVAFTQRKQALHDMICDTLVVDKWAYTAHPEWQRRELGAVTIAILAIGAALVLLGIVLFGAVFAALFGSYK
jgi:uncharacterized RDD family membrane protein YckC